MFEEAELAQNSITRRLQACQSQCRLLRVKAGGSILDGGCPCDAPVDCIFNIAEPENYPDRRACFPDIKNYYLDLMYE